MTNRIGTASALSEAQHSLRALTQAICLGAAFQSPYISHNSSGMILDPNNHDTSMKPQADSNSSNPAPAPLDIPPSYDAATEGSSMPSPRIDPPSHPVGPGGFVPQSPSHKQQPYRDESREPLIPHGIAGPSSVYMQPMMTAQPAVYNYVNPATGQVLVSLLPPHHPEIMCIQSGGHYAHTEYGWLGILAAVFWFPLGIGLCLLDRKVRCQRCGTLIESGPCS